MLTEAYLGLGSNLGDRAASIDGAFEMLREVCRRVDVSALYETDAAGFSMQPAFLNAACRVWTDLDAHGLMHRLKEIEAAAGRKRVFVNAPRTLDIDILLYGRLVVETPVLTVPHPKMAERAFVLAPLAEIAPGAVHPVLKATAAELLSCLDPAAAGVRVFARTPVSGGGSPL
jgi:2-amino-4-hydroxy-6-hydroxymethyldihydropteridine diphosphokinase